METPIGLYRGHVTPIDRIVQTTVGRHEMLEDLLEKLQKGAGKKGGQHYLFIGPRGIGKTHFLSLVENAVESRESLSRLYTVIRFPEENNRMLSFADIILEIVRSLAETETNGEWKAIHTSLSSSDEDQKIVDTAVPRLKRYQEQAGKILLLLMENLDSLFSEQIKNEQDIHRFRTFLMDSPCATLIGTSPVYFPGLTNARMPFYDFFDIQVLEDLTEELTVDLVVKNLGLEDRGDLLKNMEELAPKIKALHTMTGGNPRLIMMLYELIAHERILDVKLQFQKLLDQITPFYQDRMKDLAPQERALLETMALMRTEPRTPAAMAARMRKAPQQISSLLKRMVKAGYITVSENPNDKRSRLYRIKEGFFDLWLAMSESRTVRKRLDYFVSFFEIYYRERTEREKKRSELWKRVEESSKGQTKRQDDLEFLDYLSELGDGEERFKAKLELSIHQLKEGDALKAKDLLVEAKPLASERGIFTWLTEQALRWSESGPSLDVSQWFDGMIQYWKTQRSGELEGAVAIAEKLGMDLSGRGLHKIRIELLQDALRCATRPEHKIGLHLQMADSQRMDGQTNVALHTLETALDLSRESDDKKLEGATLNNIGQIYDFRGDYDTALKYLEQSLMISRERGDKESEGATLNNVSHIYDARGHYETALKYLEQSLKISKQIGDKAGEAVTLNNISQVYSARGEYKTALKYLEQSLKAQEGIKDKVGESATLNNISQVYRFQGDYTKALEYLEQSLTIRKEIGDKAGEGVTLNNIGQIYSARGDYETALRYLEQSLIIQKNIGDKTGEGVTLNNIGQIYDARGDYEMALRFLEQSLEIHKETGNREGEGVNLNNISQIYDALGDHEMALKYLEQSLTIRKEIGDKAGEGVTLNNISQIYDALGDYEMALKYLEQSLTIRKEIGDKAGEGVTLNNIGQVHNVRGDYEMALKYLEQSLTIRKEIGDKAGEGATLNNIGQVYNVRGDHEEALNYLEQSLDVTRGIRDRVGMIPTLHNMAGIALKTRDVKRAVEYWTEALPMAIETGNAEGIFHVAGSLGRVLARGGDKEQAAKLLRIAVQVGRKAGFAGTDQLEEVLKKQESTLDSL